MILGRALERREMLQPLNLMGERITPTAVYKVPQAEDIQNIKAILPI